MVFVENSYIGDCDDGDDGLFSDDDMTTSVDGTDFLGEYVNDDMAKISLHI